MTDTMITSERIRERGNAPYLASDANGEAMLQFADDVVALEQAIRELVAIYKSAECDDKRTPLNYTICMKCGAEWANGSGHDYHEEECIYELSDKTRQILEDLK